MFPTVNIGEEDIRSYDSDEEDLQLDQEAIDRGD